MGKLVFQFPDFQCFHKEIGDGVIPCAIPYMIHTLPDTKQNAAGNMPLENAGIDIKVGKVVEIGRASCRERV